MTDNSWPVGCPYCDLNFDSMDSYGDSRQMLDDHIKKDHTFTSECSYCHKVVSGEPTQQEADYLLRLHIITEHYKDECGYCGEVFISVDSLEDAQAQQRAHILQEHPGILDG